MSLVVRPFAFLLIFFLSACADRAPSEQADVILHSGKVVTVDDDLPEAEAVAIAGDRILAVGSNAEIDAYLDDDTEVIDLAGRLAIPGLIEGHGHFMGVGNAAMILNLRTPETWEEIVALVAEAVREAEPGAWIAGRGWHQDKWTATPSPNVEGFPVHRSLSAVSPDNPVVLTHASGHASFVNAAALAAAGITAATPDPQGGEILRDANGAPTGLLREKAQGLVSEARSAAEQRDRTALWRRQAELAARESVAKGITSFQDAGSSFELVDFLKEEVDRGALPLRLYVMIRSTNDDLRENMAAYRTVGYGDNRLTVAAIKLSIDGALGARGAWLLEPYHDAPHLTGLNLIPVPDVEETARIALEHDVQLAVHAIGDRANREVLDIFADAFETAGVDGAERRWRIEHAQHLHPDDIPRFGSLGVIASMQGVHCTSDAPWVPDRLGDRRSEEGAYVWQKLMQSGAIVTNGTDAPVEDVDPIASFYASVSRRTVDGEVFYGSQRMTREEALRSYTLNNAIAAFEEDLKGSITPGKLADITVLSADILTIPEEEIRDAQVDLTMVGGTVVYERE